MRQIERHVPARIDVAPRHAPGRIKQWLNLLRRNYPQGETLFQQLRLLRDATEIDLQVQALAPPQRRNGATRCSGAPSRIL